MPKIPRILIISLLLFSNLSIAQHNYTQVATIPIQADFFTTDKQGNIYVVKANELSKYNKSGKLLYKYSNKNLGNIDFVDASNMLRLLLFYKNFTQAVFLDNTLTLSGDPVSLDKIGFQQAQLMCTSYNNGMWLYNQQNLELVRLTQAFSKTQETGNLSILLNTTLQPTVLIEYDNNVFLNNPATGILLFDIYGTYYKTLPIKNVQFIQPLGNLVYYKNNNKIQAYNIKTTEESAFEVPLADFLTFRLELNELVLQTAENIIIYTAQ